MNSIRLVMASLFTQFQTPGIATLPEHESTAGPDEVMVWT